MPAAAVRITLGLLTVPVRAVPARAMQPPPPAHIVLSSVGPVERAPRPPSAHRWLVDAAPGSERALELLARAMAELGAAVWARSATPSDGPWEGLLVPAAGGLVLASDHGEIGDVAGEGGEEEVGLATRLLATLPVRASGSAPADPATATGEPAPVADLALARAARRSGGAPARRSRRSRRV